MFPPISSADRGETLDPHPPPLSPRLNGIPIIILTPGLAVGTQVGGAAAALNKMRALGPRYLSLLPNKNKRSAPTDVTWVSLRFVNAASVVVVVLFYSSPAAPSPQSPRSLPRSGARGGDKESSNSLLTFPGKRFRVKIRSIRFV